MAKPIVFNVSKGFNVPDYSGYSTDLIERALTAGFGLVNDTIRLWKPLVALDPHRDIQRDAYKEAYETRLSIMQATLDDYKIAMTGVQEMRRDLATQQLHSQIDGLKAQVAALQAQTEIGKVQIDSSKQRDAALDKLAAKITNSVSDTLDEFSTTLEPFRALHGKTTDKGKQTENVVQGIILSYFNTASIEDTSRTGNSGDLQMDLRGNRYLIEVKNMKVVNKKHVEEFERVVGVNNATISAGIFISLNCAIAGKGSLCVEMLGDIPVVYVWMDHESSIYSAIEVLHCYCELARKFKIYREEKSRVSDDATIEMKALISTTMTNVSMMLNMCEPLRHAINDMIGQIDKYERHARTVICDTAKYLEKNPIMKLESMDIVALEQKAAAQGFTVSEIDKLVYDGSSITSSNVLRVLGQANGTYIKARGGMTKLKAIIAARRKELKNGGGDSSDDDSTDDAPTYTTKELDKLSALAKRPTLKEAMSTIKVDKTYIKKRGGVKALYELIVAHKKKIKQKAAAAVDDANSSSSSSDSESSDS